jgi:hypothetical protein
MREMKTIRGAFEVLGVGAFFGLHFGIIWWVYWIGSDLGVATSVYWAAIALGYSGMISLAVFRRRAFGVVSPRRLLDAWLLAFPMAIGVSLLLLVLRWPLQFPGWDAHGVGASGGEANSLFLPWLHLAIWLLVAKWPISNSVGAEDEPAF